jgi:hypothetical protein
MILISELLDQASPSPDDIAASVAKVQNIESARIRDAVAVAYEVYVSMGSSDKAAKGKDMTKAVQAEIDKFWV